MLTVQQYKDAYPNAPYTSKTYFPLQEELLLEGYLLFSEKTAYNWAGPFEGGYAYFTLIDYTEAVSNFPATKGHKYLDMLAKAEANRKAKAERSIYPERQGFQRYLEDPSWEFPTKLWMAGNDDTSYSKCYASRQEAMEEMELFSSNEPLDFDEVIRGFNFMFTN